MRGLLALVIAMGVLIVAGVGILAVTIMHRLSTPGIQPALALAEPAGTRMQAIAPAGDRLAILLTGGGPDRVILLDPRTGNLVGRVGLLP
jgi:hypothetical protein